MKDAMKEIKVLNFLYDKARILVLVELDSALERKRGLNELFTITISVT